MHLAECAQFNIWFYQPSVRTCTSASGTYHVSCIYVLSVLYTYHRNLTGSIQSQILSWKCSCRRGAGQPIWSSSPKNVRIMVVLREKKRKSHIFHDCLYVRLGRGYEHQSLLHDKHLLGNNYIKLGKTRTGKLKQGKRRRSISLR